MRNKVLGCLGVFVVVALLVSVILNIVLITLDGANQVALDVIVPQKPTEVLVERGKGKDRILHIDLVGMIANDDLSGYGGGTSPADLKRALRHGINDENVKAIVLRINSPGGEVTASDVMYNEVKKANAVKPVIVYMDSLAASGGYYAACGARKIIANETTLTGSIGVIIQTLNYRELVGKIGLDMVVFRSGKFKDTLSGSREMRDDEKEMTQKMVMDMYEKFVGIVSEARKIPLEQLKDGIADGRVFTGQDALQVNLVDQLGYVEDAYNLARKEGGAPTAHVVRYQEAGNLGDLLGLFAKGADPKRVEIDLADRLIPRLQSGRVYLLPSFYAN